MGANNTSNQTLNNNIVIGGQDVPPQTNAAPLVFVMNQISASAIYSVVPFSRGRRGGGSSNERPIKFRCFLQNTILDVLRSRGWIEISEYD